MWAKVGKDGASICEALGTPAHTRCFIPVHVGDEQEGADGPFELQFCMFS